MIQYTIPPNSVAVEPSITTSLQKDQSQATVYAPNYSVMLPGAKNGAVTYTPFMAQPGTTWAKSVHISDIISFYTQLT
jgi:hypothetical protein